MLAVAPAPLPAQSGVGVRAYVSPGSTVGLGQAFVLNVEVSGTRSVDRNPQIPNLDAFARYMGSSTQTSVRTVNGQANVQLTIQYQYRAMTEGAFQIPSFEVAAGGQVYRTDPIDLVVAEAGAARSPDSGIGEDDLFITAEASSTTVREGEPLVVEYRIWRRVDVTNFGTTFVPEPEGFWVEDVTPAGQPEVEQRSRGDVQYATAVVRRIALIPSTEATSFR